MQPVLRLERARAHGNNRVAQGGQQTATNSCGSSIGGSSSRSGVRFAGSFSLRLLARAHGGIEGEEGIEEEGNSGGEGGVGDAVTK